jgi:hypothetical protein
MLRTVLLICVMLAIGPAAAHHGWGNYDTTPVTVTGVIATVQFRNPHAEMTVRTAEKTWTVTLAPISRMRARGATEKLVAVGKTVTAMGYRSRSNPDEIRAERITIDGKTVEMR